MGGCQSKSAQPKAQPGKPTAGGAPKSAMDGWPTCHFCQKKIPAREYNGHTVQCDEREVTCWHSWCREIVKQGQLQAHMEQCAKRQKTICAKCGANVLVTELQQHRDSCSLVQCQYCPEKTIGRILKYCPTQLLGKLQINVGPFATKALQAKFCNNDNSHLPLATLNYNVARLQHLFRWVKARMLIEDAIFRLIHKEMDLRKEGFAIFKAHDRFHDSQVVAPKRSRSVLQVPTVPPSSVDHYFPASSSVPITVDHISRMIKDLTNHTLLPYPAAWRIFTDAMNHLNALPNIVRLTPFAGARLVGGRWHQGMKIVVVGDLHGQLADLLHILGECGMPSESNFYVFNGDFVDRGPYGVEVLLILFSLMLAFPKYVTLNRGNHECDYMNEEYGFDVEVSTKYDRNVFRLIQRCFCALPLGTVIGNKVFVVHGGIPRRKGITLEDISRIQRFRQIPMPEHLQPEEDEIFQDMLWSDPREAGGWQESERGAGVQFGADITEDFLKTNGMELVIRSHEEYQKGYEEHHNGQCVTVFSASNYDGPDTNNGAFLLLTGDCTEPSFHTYQVYEDEFVDLVPIEEITQTPTSVQIQSRQSFLLATQNSFRMTFSQGPMRIRKRTKDEVLRILRERIYQRRHRLLAYFTKLDRTHKGSVWKIEWVETMRNVLNLDLPWFFLRRYIAEEDPETHRILYSMFLSKFHNGMMRLWLKDWEQAMASHITNRQQATHRIQHLHSAFAKEKVNYNEFCSVMRAIDYTLSDAQLFQLFQFFDKSGTGHINGQAFLNEIDHAPPQTAANPLKWDLDAMEQLQNIVIQGRSQLHSIFKVSSKDRNLTKDKFYNGMTQLSRGMKKQLTQQQKDAVLNFMNPHRREEISFDNFLAAFAVFDASSVSSKRLSQEFIDTISPLPTTPVQNGSVVEKLKFPDVPMANSINQDSSTTSPLRGSTSSRQDEPQKAQ